MKLKLENLIELVLRTLEACYLNLYYSKSSRGRLLLAILTIALPGFILIGIILTMLNLVAVLMGKAPGDIAFCWDITRYALYGIVALITYILIFGKN